MTQRLGHAHPARAALVAVRRKPHCRLVGKGHDRKVARASETVEQAERKIPRQAEDVLDPPPLC